MALKKFCNHRGCNEIAEERYCDKHKRAEQSKDRYRQTAAKRGYGHKWRKESKQYLQDNPLCVHCEAEGRITPANVVDHIKPHKGDMKLFWNRRNWQPLCKKHHDRKTAMEDGGFGRTT